MHTISVMKINFKITHLKLQPHLPGAKDLRYIHGLAQQCSNSIAKALELLQSYAKSIILYHSTIHKKPKLEKDYFHKQVKLIW